MWNNWAESARKNFQEVSEKAAEALEKTGDALTKAASNPHSSGSSSRKVQKPKPVDITSPRNLESIPAAESPAAEAGAAATTSTTGSSADDIRAAAMAALARADSAEEGYKRRSNSKNSNNYSSNSNTSSSNNNTPKSKLSLPHLQLKSPDFQHLSQNVSKGWHTFTESAKKGVAAAQEAVELEQKRLELLVSQRNAPKYYSRELRLPLDVPALKAAEVVYVTDRIISMSHPALPTTNNNNSNNSNDNISGERKLAAVAHLLEKRHGSGNVMIWNLSEVSDYHKHASAVLERVGPVMAFSFPGSPAPPLGLWLQLLLSLERWLQASSDNVAVVHCLTGKGRTSTVLAAFLCWMAEAGFEQTKMTTALQYVAQCKKMSVQELTIPSQRRYAQYFTNMLEGIKPQQPPLVLKRIIMSEAPHFALGPPISNKNKKDSKESSSTDSSNNDKDSAAVSSPTKQDHHGRNDNENDDDGSQQVGENRDRMGCAPYVQVFQAGQLLHTVAATLHFQQQPDTLPFCQVADGSIAFHVDQVIQGDVLIRCRHLAHSTRQKISMFRAAFHTGYAPPNVLRFTKEQLDGACNDPRFPDDFFVDLILEPCTNEQAAQFYQEQEFELQEKQREREAAAESHQHVEKDAVVSASTYDSMLHRDSRFWDVIADHLKQNESKKGEGSNENDDANKDDGDGGDDDESTKKKRLWGPTVGKRRVFTSSSSKADDNTADGKQVGGSQGSTPAQAALQTFSIGGELDFLPEPEKKSAAKPKGPPKKDTLMEALMGALELDDHEPVKTEEITFDDDQPAFAAEPSPVAVQPQPTMVDLPPVATPLALTTAENAKSPAPATTKSSVTTTPPAEDAATKPGVPTTAAEAKAPEKEPAAATINKHAADETTTKAPAQQNSNVTTESIKEAENVPGAAIDDDLDMDALLADDDDDDFNLDDYDVDAEDAELEDLEAFLNSK